LKLIKADEHLKMIPVVVLTSSREMPDLIEFYKHGVNAYVVKPVSFPEFMRAVRLLGVFWGTVNEPPPHAGTKETFTPNARSVSAGKVTAEADQTALDDAGWGEHRMAEPPASYII